MKTLHQGQHVWQGPEKLVDKQSFVYIVSMLLTDSMRDQVSASSPLTCVIMLRTTAYRHCGVTFNFNALSYIYIYIYHWTGRNTLVVYFKVYKYHREYDEYLHSDIFYLP